MIAEIFSKVKYLYFNADMHNLDMDNIDKLILHVGEGIMVKTFVIIVVTGTLTNDKNLCNTSQDTFYRDTLYKLTDICTCCSMEADLHTKI